MTEHGTKRVATENLAHVTQHIIAYPFGAGGVDVAIRNLQSAQRMHGESKQRGEQADFDHHYQDRRGGCFNDARILIGTSRIEFHYPGCVGDRFHARKRQYDSDETGPVLTKRPVQWLQVPKRRAEMRQAEKSEHNDNDRGGNGNQERESTRLFRSEQIK